MPGEGRVSKGLWGMSSEGGQGPSNIRPSMDFRFLLYFNTKSVGGFEQVNDMISY